jgi:hypothetical protein
MGRGFNLVSLPRNPNPQVDNSPFRLKVAPTMEILHFEIIGAPIPNRSSTEDIEFLGLIYLQKVANATTGEGMHVEPGLWLNMPDLTIARLGTIPHGDSLLAQGDVLDFIPGPPPIQKIHPAPFKLDPNTGQRINVSDPVLSAVFTNASTNPPAGVTAGLIADPNSLLQDDINTLASSQRKIIKTDTLFVSSNPIGGINGTRIVAPTPQPSPTAPSAPPPDPTGGIVNIPFIRLNANAMSLSAIFWIETIQNPDGHESMQLQYTQTVILDFDDIKWPHISVATLIKQ